jgi:glycosyltransferase involved in cell wall biosynthesis
MVWTSDLNEREVHRAIKATELQWESVGCTAVVATSGPAPFLEAAIRSIRAQSFPPIETIVVVNGALGSDTLHHVSRKYPDLTCVEVERRGQAYAYGVALKLVTTPLVSFLDDDDCWTTNKQELQVSLLARNQSSECAIGGVQVFGSGSHVSVKHRSVVARLFGATTFRTSAFERLGRPDPGAGHFQWMYRWWISATKKDIRLVYHEEVVLLKRIHAGSSWTHQNQEGRRQLLAELRHS